MVDTVTNNSEMVKEIELNIKQAQQFVDLGNALDRLRSNKDFKAVIADGYLASEAIRLVHLKSDVNMQTAERQDSIVKQIDAIGILTQYFDTIRHKASLALKAISADEETRDELLAEDLNNE